MIAADCLIDNAFIIEEDSLPISMAAELETLINRDFSYELLSLRYKLVSISGLAFIYYNYTTFIQKHLRGTILSGMLKLPSIQLSLVL